MITLSVKAGQPDLGHAVRTGRSGETSLSAPLIRHGLRLIQR
jgi:hypothetical protein